jgi:hypothetical protein
VTDTPAGTYRARRDERQGALDRLTAAGQRISHVRLALFALFAAVVLLAWRDVVSAWILVLPVAAFVVAVRRHERVIGLRETAARAVAFYERGLARIDDRWQGLGSPGDRFLTDAHLYARDLDLFGRGSLFELLSVARTQAGEATLAGWLLAPAPPGEIVARQEAVAELADRLDLREDLAVAGTHVGTGIHPDELVAWAEARPVLAPGWVRWPLLALTASVVVAIGVWLVTDDMTPLLVLLGVQAGLAWPAQRKVERVLHQAARSSRDLDILGHLLRRLEGERFESPRLAELRRAVDAEDGLASVAIRSLVRLVELHDWQHNLYFLMLSIPFMWGTHVAWAIEAWRARHGRHIRPWLDAVAEVEALSSLAAHRYEHPGFPFPEIVVSGGGSPAAVFDGEDLRHPLLPSVSAVANDVRRSGQARLVIVSGSNMSGKSTLLRTVGVNAVLAHAGAPVRARSLRLAPLAIGATLRIQDSLLEGRSRFYAEVTRVRALSDLADGPAPLLFLLDELFHGTSSHDRLVGASAVLRNLVDRGAIGLITTHDLALTAIARALAPRAVNVHFADRFEDGELRFDYRMRSGPVTHSNAIALMRSVGLDVPEG